MRNEWFGLFASEALREASTSQKLVLFVLGCMVAPTYCRSQDVGHCPSAVGVVLFRRSCCCLNVERNSNCIGLVSF